MDREPKRGINGEVIPQAGQWPVDPQEDQHVRDDRLWVDGCFDFAHHGHMGAILQARRLGKELYVGVHSDEDIMANKGPTVMTLDERILAADACRWTTKVVPSAPYVTSLDWITHYGCQFVVHGDDITSDASGEDCYRYVKAAGRFKVVKRTPGISTTDLVGRMLLCTNNHHIRSRAFRQLVMHGPDTPADGEGVLMLTRIKDYASGPSGTETGCDVFLFEPSSDPSLKGNFHSLVMARTSDSWNEPYPDQRIVYVDGGFDLFCSGHIEFLRNVIEAESEIAQKGGWYEKDRVQRRIQAKKKDYPPVFVVAGVHDDDVINDWKGINYPIMNMYERGLCVLGCKYVSALIFSAPYIPDVDFLRHFPYGRLEAVYHGPTISSKFGATLPDPYKYAKELGLYQKIKNHKYGDVSADSIVKRILTARELYEERQRVKGVKGLGEEAVKKREELEAQAKKKKLQQQAGIQSLE